MDYSLVCLPFAGGGAGFYRAWRDLPAGGPDIVPVQLPGREELFLEDPYRDAVEAADALAGGVGGPGGEARAGRGPGTLWWGAGRTPSALGCSAGDSPGSALAK